MQEKDKKEMVDMLVEVLDKHHKDKTEAYMKKHYCFLNDKFGIDFNNDDQVREFQGSIRLIMKFTKGLNRASNIIGTAILISILSGIGYIIKLGIIAWNKG